MHIEVQTKDDHEMLFRMQEYHAMLLRKYRMRIFQMVFYIGEGKKIHDSGGRLKMGGNDE